MRLTRLWMRQWERFWMHCEREVGMKPRCKQRAWPPISDWASGAMPRLVQDAKRAQAREPTGCIDVSGEDNTGRGDAATALIAVADRNLAEAEAALTRCQGDGVGCGPGRARRDQRAEAHRQLNVANLALTTGFSAARLFAQFPSSRVSIP